jgi:hypothetical protein
MVWEHMTKVALFTRKKNASVEAGAAEANPPGVRLSAKARLGVFSMYRE